MVELKSFTKYYNKTLAVSDVSFLAPSNCITALVGLNGAGKTTILKAISGIHYPDEGSVLVNNIDVAQFPEKVKKECGFVAEQPLFYPGYLVCELLETDVFLRNTSMGKKDLKKKVKALLQQFSLTSVSSKKIKELSKGYRQRLSFARAFCSNPSVLLLDEPMTGLDPRQIIEMRTLIKQISSTRTVIISTHIMHEVEEFCTYAIVLNKGSVVAADTPAAICRTTHTNSFEKAFMVLTKEESDEK